jgi:hypothetical protein
MFAHIVCLAFASFVAYSARPNFTDAVWFAWHPTLMTAAFSFLAVESVLMLSKSSLLGASARRNNKVIGHWVLMGLAVGCAILGFLAVYFTKEVYGKPHLATPHGLLGCATVGYMIIQSCAGWNLIFPQFVSKFVDMKVLRKVHGLSGTFLLLLATLAVLGGLTTDWFHQRVTGPAWYACLASPLIIFALIAKQVLFGSKDKAEPTKKKS